MSLATPCVIRPRAGPGWGNFHPFRTLSACLLPSPPLALPPLPVSSHNLNRISIYYRCSPGPLCSGIPLGFPARGVLCNYSSHVAILALLQAWFLFTSWPLSCLLSASLNWTQSPQGLRFTRASWPVCVCVCVCVCVYGHSHVSVHVCTHTCVHTCLHLLLSLSIPEIIEVCTEHLLFLFFVLNLFIFYFWLHWVFVAA